jgi:hypothetical protein
MPEYQRPRGFLFLGKRQELGSEIATYIGIECREVCGEETVQD